MTHVELCSDFDVTLFQHSGSDAMTAAAARVSTGAELLEFPDKEADEKLIKYLLRHRHGSPFEHSSMTFRIEAPIFVWREFMRHRIGFSYNEVSGRYTKLQPKFYTYPVDRPLVQEGSSAHPELSHGHPALTPVVNGDITRLYNKAWKTYETLLDDGVAKEVARTVLPVGIYSSAYVTCNARSMMSFLSLRVDGGESAMFETKPQWEIQQVAMQMEEIFAEHFPATHEAFVSSGRVSP
ncbi:MAG: FAD-dependent thymidylate synthase [Cetobacterium sp.]